MDSVLRRARKGKSYSITRAISTTWREKSWEVKNVSSSQVYILFNRKKLHTVNSRVLLLFGQSNKRFWTHSTLNRVSLLYESLNVSWRMTTHWKTLHTVNNYMVSHQNELLSASSDHCAEQRISHNDHKERVSFLYEPLNVVWGNLTDWRS